ncbi:MAG: SDR family NAD(P)-dependent oxidoreductase [Myxococcota bacterium]
MHISTRYPLKRAFITGAGSGLGRSLALQLAHEGWTVGIQDIKAEGAEETLQQVRAAGGQGEVYLFDVSQRETFAKHAQQFIDKHDGVDLVVNNAGVAVGGFFDQIPAKDWEWIAGINLFGPVYGCQAFLPQLRRQGKGYLINVASVAGLVAGPGMSPYHATKYATVGFSEALRGELVGSGVGLSVVCPYFFQTNILNDARINQFQAAGLAGKAMRHSSAQADQVARRILDGAARGQFYIVPHLEAKLMWWFKRFSPSLFFWLLDRGTLTQLRHQD